MPRIFAGAGAVPLAAATALFVAAGANLGYAVQPAWFVFAALAGALTLGLAGVCVAGTAPPTRFGWLAGTCLIAGFLVLVVIVVPAQPSKRHAREVGLRLLARVPPYPQGRVTGYVLDAFGPGGDYGPSYLHPPDGYSLSRLEVLPDATDVPDAARYFRRALQKLGFRTTVTRPANDAPVGDAMDPLVQVSTTGDPPAYIVVLWRDAGGAHAEVSGDPSNVP